MDAARRPRVAALGVHLESNAFAPVSGEADFRRLCYLEGEDILAEARHPAPALPAEIPGFLGEVARGEPWTIVPILVTAAEPGGPIDHDFFQRLLGTIERRLAAALPLDAVYISNHGGMTSTATHDPDGELYARVRATVGPGVPIAATVDLHANISERMVGSVDVLVSYRTNPHVDQHERGAEAARHLRTLLAGTKAKCAFIRLPLTPASVALLTAEGPYADLIRAGQQQATPEILNVSVIGGFVFSDTPKNGIAVVVTAKDDVAPARRVALQLARRAWAERQRFVRELMPLERAIELAVANGEDHSLPPVIFSDAGDNPGGGGRGNTAWFLEALHRAGAQGVLLGVFVDAALAAETHARGVGARFEAVFNRESESEFSRRFAVPAVVTALHEGKCVGRRGIWAGRSLDLGPTALLEAGGVKVVVATNRKQCADPVFFEMLGLDIAKARSVVVKSRGHFRAGFDEFFTPEQIYEVDPPGLTAPMLARIRFKHLPRPVFPLDRDATWQEPPW